jgi:hypothetical protein
MSSLMGAAHERWSLSRAIDALGDAARQAGAPGMIWLAGILYPTLSLSLGYGGELALFQVREGELTHPRLSIDLHDPWTRHLPPELWPALLPIVPIFMRLIIGLARISSPQRWSELTIDRRAPRLRDAWSAGKGLSFSSFGLWLQLVVMLLGAAVVLLVPPFFFLRGLGLRGDSSWELAMLAVLMGPFIAVLMIYGFLLSVLYQLALQSLAQNRRGVSSAVHHAWRIARHDPWATTRAVIVDFLLYVTTLILEVLIAIALGITIIGIPLVVLAIPILLGFSGTTRACYWARTYRVLGGLSAEDGVPGL